MKVLLSIKPEFAEKIFSGEKRFEYRKSIFKEKVDTIVVYVSMPVGKIIGELSIREIIEAPPNELWEKTKNTSGISHDFFIAYFKGKKKGYAIKIGKVERYDKPVNPYNGSKSFVPPQSFRYLHFDY